MSCLHQLNCNPVTGCGHKVHFVYMCVCVSPWGMEDDKELQKRAKQVWHLSASLSVLFIELIDLQTHYLFQAYKDILCLMLFNKVNTSKLHVIDFNKAIKSANSLKKTHWFFLYRNCWSTSKQNIKETVLKVVTSILYNHLSDICLFMGGKKGNLKVPCVVVDFK